MNTYAKWTLFLNFLDFLDFLYEMPSSLFITRILLWSYSDELGLLSRHVTIHNVAFYKEK